MDGFHGSAGEFRLRWEFVATTSAPPVIVSVPFDQSVREGDTVTLAVTLQSATPLDVAWRYNGNSLDQGGPTDNSSGENTTTLVITDFRATNAGHYSLRIRMETEDGRRVQYHTTPAELQLNSEGHTNAFARDKLFDSVASPFIGDDGSEEEDDSRAKRAKAITKGTTTGVTRGYDGSQIFNTTYATTDPSEPHHCGFVPSASYWFTYQPPTNGTAMIDTSGSRYDNVVAAYTYAGTVTSYGDLVPITCDYSSGGVNGSRIEFAVMSGRQYAIVVAGVNGARGIARLNYHLDTDRPPAVPTLASPAVPLLVAAGSNVTLRAAVNGSAPLHFQWSRSTVPIPGATNRELEMLNVAPPDSGEYAVSVWNHLGALSIVLPLRVVITPRLEFHHWPGGGVLTFTPVAGQRYVIEHAGALGGTWLPVGDAFVSDGGDFVLTNSLSDAARFYRVRVE